MTADQLFGGDVRLFDLTRRNANVAVMLGEGGFFVKHGADADRRATLAREHAALLHLHWPRRGGAALRAIVPAAIATDDGGGWLVTRLVPRADTLANRVRQGRRVSARAIAMVGRGLGTLHGTPVAAADRAATAPPRALSFVEPTLADLAEFSDATTALCAAAQASPGIVAGLRDIGRLWVPRCHIHGDVRWENVVISQPRRARDTRRARGGAARGWLVDWEFLHFGDPLWDVGCFYGEALWCHLTALATHDDAPPDPALSRVSMTALRPLLAGFWHVYWSARREAPSDDARLAVVRFAALRLFGRFFERSRYQRELDRQTVLALQVVENLHREPARGVRMFWPAS